MVVPVDPFQDGQFDLVQALPRRPRPDEFGLEQADLGLGQGVVVGVADRSDRGEGEGTFGLSVEPLTASRARELGVRATTGLVITDVAPDGRAAAAGLRPGDVIEQVDRKPVTSGDELRTALNDGKRPALLQVHRGSVTLFVASCIVAINFVVDLTYAVLDPRIRYD